MHVEVEKEDLILISKVEPIFLCLIIAMCPPFLSFQIIQQLFNTINRRLCIIESRLFNY